MRDAEPERALIIAVLDQGDDGRGELDEMRELLRTAGASPSARSRSTATQPDPRTYLGAGKLDEVAAAIGATSAEAVVLRRRAHADAAARARGPRSTSASSTAPR